MTLSLALCLDAPMQSWGIRSRFTMRETTREPTKSGIVGLLGAALGIPRDDEKELGRLAGLRMAVRVDREGILERDYHTAQNVPTTAGTGHRTVVSERYYLADALFLVVLEGDEATLTKAAAAVQRPHWPLCFGRKPFVPARPLTRTGRTGEPRTGEGLQEKPLHTVLSEHPWLETRPKAHARALADLQRGETIVLRTMTDCDPAVPGAEPRHDQPISLVRNDRRFTTRAVLSGHVALTEQMISAGDSGVPEQAQD
ncbi:type I-E CRISPR-associated protein Cas5/CasD [Microbispora bryophytorum]|uniref:Type I-E CRISPR-associated protein Cas5/CasD n=1 Tax=Microbispora bryophytorum subsp. camponoti TaxID=1677852 RepID=A0ABR8LIH5_9ACTN|nr:type I-E CRISPR-associated protein Cas5/CasD [Microbispora camponoti]MBD3148288.1 type I-E CRISPR-associated protein Cas5/CasD [Microbispora camponoti]